MIPEIKIDKESAQEWSEYELQDVSLGDKRLDWRLRDIAAKFAAHPQGSINQACDDWADTKAAYRLFDNEKTTPEKILSPHYERTRERIAAHELVLAIQDTSYLDYCQFAHVSVPVICGQYVPPICGQSVPGVCGQCVPPPGKQEGETKLSANGKMKQPHGQRFCHSLLLLSQVGRLRRFVGLGGDNGFVSFF